MTGESNVLACIAGFIISGILMMGAHLTILKKWHVFEVSLLFFILGVIGAVINSGLIHFNNTVRRNFAFYVFVGLMLGALNYYFEFFKPRDRQ